MVAEAGDADDQVNKWPGALFGRYDRAAAAGPTTPPAGATRSPTFAPGAPDPTMQRIPPAQGLYDPVFEHDSCGVSFVVDLQGRRSHRIVELGFSALCHLDHRGAKGAEPNTGDGSGLLIQVPDRFLREVVDFSLPTGGVLCGGHRLPPRRSRPGRRGCGPGRGDRGQGGAADAGLAGRPRRPGRAGRHRTGGHAHLPPAVRQRPRGSRRQRRRRDRRDAAGPPRPSSTATSISTGGSTAPASASSGRSCSATPTAWSSGSTSPA